jgi:hypothetical protein
VVKNTKDKNIGLETLLNLDGEIFPMDNGYWVKFKVHRIEPNENIPHGIRYSLTLHDKYNRRLIGYDNAHGIKPKRKKFCGTRTVWGHKHNHEKVHPYDFEKLTI